MILCKQETNIKELKYCLNEHFFMGGDMYVIDGNNR